MSVPLASISTLIPTMKGNTMKMPLLITANLFSALYFALSSFAYLNSETLAPLANAEGTITSIGVAVAIGAGVIQFPSILAITVALLVVKD
jgi:O-acetyl-ADP-ribose deacetylase (regulator of RNase III)